MPKRYALVIGVSKYKDLHPLPGVVNDVNKIAESLETLNPEDESLKWQVECYPCKPFGKDGDRRLSRATVLHTDILDKIGDFLFNTARGASALIYFAGHGLRVQQSSYLPAKGYLATTDSDHNGNNAISIEDLNRLFLRARYKANLSSLILILDCCHAGMSVEGMLEREWLMQSWGDLRQQANFGVLAACRGNKKAYEDKDNGIFTRAILKGLEKPNLATRSVTFTSLINYVVHEDKDFSNSRQECVFFIDNCSEVIGFPVPQALKPESGKRNEAFLRLFRRFNYRKPDRIFREFIEDADRRVGAFWIRGKRDSAQKWLLSRLWIDLVPGSTSSDNLKTFKIRSRSSINDLWEQLARWLGTEPKPEAIIQEIIERYKNQKTVAIILYEIEWLSTPDLQTFMDCLWGSLVKQAIACDLDTPLLLFLVDLGRKGDRSCPIDFGTTYDNDRPERLVELVADKFQDRDFRWVTDCSEELQPYLNGFCPQELKQRVMEFNQQLDVRPIDVLIELCKYCEIDWDRDIVNQYLSG